MSKILNSALRIAAILLIAESLLTGFHARAADSHSNALFLPYQAIRTGSSAEAVATGDLNHDGRTDVALVTTYYFDPANDYKVMVFLQDADGHLVLDDKYAIGTGTSVAIADVNNDGLDDVITPTATGLGVLTQSASGKLNPMVIYPDSNSSLRVAVGDFNHDGLKDVAAIAWGSNQVSVFLQKSDGTLAPAVHYDALHDGYDDLKVGDVNGNRLDDIVVMSGQGFDPNFTVLTQLSSGGFGSSLSYSVGGNELSNSVAIGDINGDGRNDIALSTWLNHDRISSFIQNGSGYLDRGADYGSWAEDTMQFGDVDGDGLADLVGAGDVTLRVFPRARSGGFQNAQTYLLPYATFLNPNGLAVADVNNDGALDAVMANYNYGLVVLLNRCITSDLIVHAEQWKFFSYQITADNGARHFEADQTALNSIGLKLDESSGRIYGALLSAGTFDFLVRAINGSRVGSATIELVVSANAPPTPTPGETRTPEPPPTATVDTVAPRIHLVGESVRETSYGFVILSGTATDNHAVRTVELRQGHGPYLSVSGRPSFWYQLATLNPGRNVFYIRAIDTSGNVSSVKRVVVTRQ